MDSIEKIFDEIVEEAKKGQVIIDDAIYNIKFDVSYDEITKDNTLKISDKNKFLSILDIYVKLIIEKYNIQNYDYKEIKKIITVLFSNITYKDFDNPQLFVEKYIDFSQNKLENITIENVECLLDSRIVLENNLQSLFLETPYCCEITISKDNFEYKLPKISYGISNNKCYIYAVQNDKKYEQNEYTKKIKRLLYKLNDGVVENDEYINFKHEKDSYYPENISDVTLSFVLALSIFIKQLDLEKISDIEVVTFLPIRYYAKEKANYKRLKYKTKVQNLDNLQRLELYKEYLKEQSKIQFNLTNKLIRNFYRLEYHLEGLKILNDVDNAYEYLKININDIKCSNNDLLNEIINRQNNTIKNK